MGEHARLGPSNARWPKCPGSVREEAAYQDISGAAAIDGTGSHLLLEMCLDNNVDAITYDGQIIGVNHEDSPMGWMVHPDRCGRVQIMLDYIVRRVKELKAEGAETVIVKAETKVNIGDIVGRTDWWGTCDVTIAAWVDGKCAFLEVADYKDGRIYVSEKNNGQLIDYCGGAINARTCRDHLPVRMTIVQPKTSTPIRYVDSTSSEVMGTILRVRAKAAALTDDPNAPLIAGKHCQWCKHKKACTAGAEKSMEVLKVMTNNAEGSSLFEMIGGMVGNVADLDNTQLADLADAKEALIAEFTKVEEEIERRIDAGDPVNGYAMLPGRGSNDWNVSDEEIEKALKARRMKKGEIFPAKLITPGALKKSELLTDDQKKRIFDKFVSYQAGTKLSLKKVARTEAKPEQTLEMMFAGVSETEKTTVSFM